MLLKELLVSTPVYEVVGYRRIEVTGVTLHPHRVKPGYLYIYSSNIAMMPYEEAIGDAVKLGAAAICIGKDEKILKNDITFVRTYNSERFISAVAKNFYRNPSQRMKLVAVTGSHGKTTVGRMIKSVLKASGVKAALLDTSHFQIGDDPCVPYRDGFNALEIHGILDNLIDEGITWGIIECSYTSIMRNQLRHIWFDSLIYTNLYTYFQNQNADFHYLEIRKTLMDHLKHSNSSIIVNMDDYYAYQIRKSSTVGYGVYNKNDVNAYQIELYPEGSNFILITSKGVRNINLKVPGIHNIYNTLSVIAWGLGQGFSLDDIKQGIEDFEEINETEVIPKNAVKGKVQLFTDNLCDPKRLENIYKNMKYLEKGNIVTILCINGSNEVHEYRELGKIINEYSQICVITSGYSYSADIVDKSSLAIEAMPNSNIYHETDYYKALQQATSLVGGEGSIIILSPSGEKGRIASSLTKL